MGSAHRSEPEIVPSMWLAWKHLGERVQRVEDGQSDMQGVVSMLLIGALEDADRILTLCSKNKIIGANQILRSMYETIIVAKYLKANPGEVENFLDFDAIHWAKMMDRIKATTGKEMDATSAENLKTRNQEARKRFRQDKCRECGRIPQLAWTPKDTDTLAKEVGLEGRYVLCFLEPTLLLHCTWWGMRPLYQGDFSVRLAAILEAVHALSVSRTSSRLR
jgi:hypothetical protein